MIVVERKTFYATREASGGGDTYRVSPDEHLQDWLNTYGERLIISVQQTTHLYASPEALAQGESHGTEYLIVRRTRP